jgi:hypothetical protein
MEPCKKTASGPPKREFDDDDFETEESIRRGMAYLKSTGSKEGYSMSVAPKRKMSRADARADAAANLADILEETQKAAAENIQRFKDVTAKTPKVAITPVHNAKRIKTQASADSISVSRIPTPLNTGGEGCKPLEDGASVKEGKNPSIGGGEVKVDMRPVTSNVIEEEGVKVYLKPRTAEEIREMELEDLAERLDPFVWVELYMRHRGCTPLQARAMYNAYVGRLMKEDPLSNYQKFSIGGMW